MKHYKDILFGLFVTILLVSVAGAVLYSVSDMRGSMTLLDAGE